MDVVVDLRPVGDLENVRTVVTEKSLTTPPLSYLKHERQLLFYRRLLRSDNIVYLFTRFFYHSFPLSTAYTQYGTVILVFTDFLWSPVFFLLFCFI